MDNDYLHELIREVQAREGGIVLNVQGKTEAVVLSIDRYNQLVRKQGTLQAPSPPAERHKVLVTGGAGYIGAHVARQLVAAGHEVVIIDNLSTGKQSNVPDGAVLIIADIRDRQGLGHVFEKYGIDVVFHLAASIDVGESFRNPLEYLDNNTLATEMLLRTMVEHGVGKVIFSSSAAVYGDPAAVPVPETAALRPNNPYGYSKLVSEHILKYYSDYKGIQAVILRPFNIAGSDFDGQVRQANGMGLIPIIMEVIAGERPHLKVNGQDYTTFDGTCVRDYVHVLDIARAYITVLDKLAELPNFDIYNVGSGRGYSVQQIAQTAAEVTGRMVPLEIGARRPGEIECSIADSRKIQTELGFQLMHSDMETILTTGWNAKKKTAPAP
jgi:UDP-glucose-4-epimerase GalE